MGRCIGSEGGWGAMGKLRRLYIHCFYRVGDSTELESDWIVEMMTYSVPFQSSKRRELFAVGGLVASRTCPAVGGGDGVCGGGCC